MRQSVAQVALKMFLPQSLIVGALILIILSIRADITLQDIVIVVQAQFIGLEHFMAKIMALISLLTPVVVEYCQAMLMMLNTTAKLSAASPAPTTTPSPLTKTAALALCPTKPFIATPPPL